MTINIVPDTNKPYFIQSRLSALVLDVKQASKTSGAKVIQWECHGGTNQQWYFEAAGDNSFNIRNANSGLYLQFGEQTSNHGKLIQANKSNQRNQRFVFNQSMLGGALIKTVLNNKAIDLRGKRAKLTQPIAWDPANSLSQSFYLCSKVPKRLQLVEVQCIQPAIGIWGGANDVSSAIATFGGAGAGVIGAGTAIAGVATGGVAIAVVGATLGVAGAGTLIASFVDDLGSGEDDLYIEKNGKKIWPGDRYQGVDKGELVRLNKTLSNNWSSSDTIQLWEYDTISSDDELTDKLRIDPLKSMWNSEFTVIAGSNSEGSIYALTFLLS